MKTYKALGLMSGSSLDGLDIVYCSITVEGSGLGTRLVDWKLLEAQTIPFSTEWKQRLLALPMESARELSFAHAGFGHYLGQLVNDFIAINGFDIRQIDLIASHGHTILHEPSQRFTLQIGDGAAIAAVTGCTVVCDFRSADIALGGQGAPLAAFADKTLFKGFDFYLNLGGIANITCNTGKKYVAFDIGAANQALNALSQEMGLAFDKDGDIASTGDINNELFEKLNRLAYHDDPYPKSLSNQWVQQSVVRLCQEAKVAVPDKLRTACEHIAYQISRAIGQILEVEGFKRNCYKIFVSGGGALNKFLIACIDRHCKKIADIEVVLPSDKIIQFKEATFMAVLGVLRMEGAPNCLASATGAKKDAIGGAVYAGQ